MAKEREDSHFGDGLLDDSGFEGPEFEESYEAEDTEEIETSMAGSAAGNTSGGQKDEDLEDEEEEIDIDALLGDLVEEDNDAGATPETKKPGHFGEEGAEGPNESIADDTDSGVLGEEDLLDTDSGTLTEDDLLDTDSGTLTEDDLLDTDSPVLTEDDLPDSGQGSVVEDEAGSEKAEAAGASEPEAVEDMEEIDPDSLLGDGPLVDEESGEASSGDDALEDDFFASIGEEGGEEEPVAAAASENEDVADETDVLDEDAIAAQGAVAAAGLEAAGTEEDEKSKKGRKISRGRTPLRSSKSAKGRFGKKPSKEKTREKAPKRTLGKKSRRAPKASEEKDRKVKAKPAVAVRGSVRFICSECYEEFLLPMTYSGDTVTCPECLHVGKRPNEDFLRTVDVHRRSERKSLAMTVLVGAVLLAVLCVFVWINTPYREFLEEIFAKVGFSNVELGAREVSYGLLGGGGILTIILVWMLVRFESNRWEVYF